MYRSHRPGGWFPVVFWVFVYAVLIGCAVLFGSIGTKTGPVPASRGGTSSWSSGPARSHADDGKIYVTRTGECYHRSWCSSLDQSKIETTLEDALADGYRPCGRCHPPAE